MVVSRVVGERDDEALVGEQLGGYVGAGIDHCGINEVPVLDAVEKRVTERRLAAFAAATPPISSVKAHTRLRMLFT